jgi:hypothetical protein
MSDSADAQTYNVLYEFPGGTHGGAPNDVIRDSAGNFYGTTVAGYGTVFKLDTSGKENSPQFCG